MMTSIGRMGGDFAHYSFPRGRLRRELTIVLHLIAGEFLIPLDVFSPF
jgi:hypothetical protein